MITEVNNSIYQEFLDTLNQKFGHLKIMNVNELMQFINSIEFILPDDQDEQH